MPEALAGSLNWKTETEASVRRGAAEFGLLNKLVIISKMQECDSPLYPIEKITEIYNKIT